MSYVFKKAPDKPTTSDARILVNVNVKILPFGCISTTGSYTSPVIKGGGKKDTAPYKYEFPSSTAVSVHVVP